MAEVDRECQGCASERLVEGSGRCVELVSSGADLDDLGTESPHLFECVLAQRGAHMVPSMPVRDGEDRDLILLRAGATLHAT